MATAAGMFGSTHNSPQPADNESKDFHASPTCDVSTSSSNLDESGGKEAVGSLECGSNTHGPAGADRTASDDARSHRSSDRTAVEKIHLLPIYEEAPKDWVFAALTGLMKERKTVRQYMYVQVKRPAKDSHSPCNSAAVENGDNACTEKVDAEYTYIVVACLPHSGVITPSSIVFTSGNPLKPLRRVQLLALVHPNSSYARRAGVASYCEALQRGLVGEASAPVRSSSRREEGNSQTGSNTNSASRSSNAGGDPATSGAANQRRHLGSPFDWDESQEDGERSRRRESSVRDYNRAEDVIAAVLDDSGPDSDVGSEDEEDSMGGATAFRLSDAEGQQNRGEGLHDSGRNLSQQQQRTLQLNFNFASSSGDQDSLGNSRGDNEMDKAALRSFSERVLFDDFVAPYFRARSASATSPSSPTASRSDGASRDTAVVMFPGKKLVIKDLTFVVWATDPGNAPGFLRSDTAVYISVDPWGEYRRVHILPFADTLPTAYTFRLFEDYLQPFLKEQPWRLIRKGDIFTYRGVEFKVIATEPSSVPVARVGPETMVHFEGTLNPSLIDILPRDVLARVRRLPARVQPFAIIAAAQSLDPQLILRVLPQGGIRGNQRGIDESLEASVERQLVGPFCLSDYQRQYAHLCTRKPLDAVHRKRLDGLVDNEHSKSQTGSVAPQTQAESTEAAAAVAEAAAGGWELEAPCCTVCTLRLQDGAESLTLTCGHAFHWECARAWLRCSATCPNCRAEVVLPPDTSERGASSEGSAGTAALGYVRNAIAEFFST